MFVALDMLRGGVYHILGLVATEHSLPPDSQRGLVQLGSSEQPPVPESQEQQQRGELRCVKYHVSDKKICGSFLQERHPCPGSYWGWCVQNAPSSPPCLACRASVLQENTDERD